MHDGDMEKQKEIPCANCQSWKRNQKKFSCIPNDCKDLTSWLLQNAPHMKAETLQMQLQLPEPIIQYIV
jgi:hypothetical protein